MVMTKSESGKLGSIVSREVQKAKKESRILLYNTAPNTCLSCDSPISYKNRLTHKFCSRSCAASQNNLIPKRIRAQPSCTICNRNVKEGELLCYSHWHLDKFEKGLLIHRESIKRILIKQFGHICQVCKREEWMGQKIPIELDHIDGNAANNLPNNLRLICPNCHAQTPTASGRNKGNGRKSRGLPWN